MVIKLFSFSAESEYYKLAMSVRRRVFVEELGLDPEYDFDGKDFDAIHFLLSVDDKPVGTARWLETKEGILIERLSIVKEYRGWGLGHLLLRYVIKDILPAKRKIYLHAPEFLMNFFLWNGFEVEGEPFEETGVTHYKMFYAKESLESQDNNSFLKKLFKRK